MNIGYEPELTSAENAFEAKLEAPISKRWPRPNVGARRVGQKSLRLRLHPENFQLSGKRGTLVVEMRTGEEVPLPSECRLHICKRDGNFQTIFTSGLRAKRA